MRRFASGKDVPPIPWNISLIRSGEQTVSDPLFAPLLSSELGEKKKSAIVAEKIFDAISTKQLLPGSKLPSEREIATQMSVSRTIVREALSALKIVGAITVRAGEGNYISEQAAPARVNPVHKTVALLEQCESPMAVWEARQSLEKTVGELALSKATAHDDRQLSDIWEEMATYGRQGNVERHLVYNTKFHQMFFNIAANPILDQIGDWMMDYSEEVITRDATNEFVGQWLEQSLVLHKEILSAFVQRDHNAFRAAIDHHFEALNHFYEDDEL